MKVLVPIDNSEHSWKAVQCALELAEKQGAEVTLMTVTPIPKFLLVLDEFVDSGVVRKCDVWEKTAVEHQGWLDKAKAIFNAKCIKVTAILEEGNVPANNIIKRAEEGKFDRIVMGSTGCGLSRILMGSTALEVVANAPCEVTIVR